MTNHYTCDSCDAEFKIKHSLDEHYSEVMLCPFYGSEIEEEHEEEQDDYE